MTALLVVLLLGAPGRAVKSYGAVLEGDVAVDGEVVVVDGKRHPRDTFHVVETTAGELLWAADRERRLRGYAYLARGKDLVDVLVARARIATGRDGLWLLREALRRDESHEGALGLLEERMPDRARGAWRARDWLDFELDVGAGGGRLMSFDAAVLKRLQRTWRDDLYGVEDQAIRLVTPIADTRIVGRCMAYGRLTADALAEIFKTDLPRARAGGRMLVFLFENEKEYQSKTGTGRKREDPRVVDNTAGYYSHTERVSRFFWHREWNAEQRIVGTFVHELTHQWLGEVNPRYADKDIRRNLMQPSYWIIEGFATFMEEGQYDIESMTWNLFDERARSLDIVQALADSGELIAWKKFYAMPQSAFYSLARDDIRFVRRWAMGDELTSQVGLFYVQGAATCHFLYFGEGGKYRRRLLSYITNAYLGRVARLKPKAAFGLTADELGAKVVAYARQVARGWKPK